MQRWVFFPFHVNISGDRSVIQQDHTWQIPVASPFLYILTSDSQAEIQHLKKNRNILAVVWVGLLPDYLLLFPVEFTYYKPQTKQGCSEWLAQGLD